MNFVINHENELRLLRELQDRHPKYINPYEFAVELEPGGSVL